MKIEPTESISLRLPASVAEALRQLAKESPGHVNHLDMIRAAIATQYKIGPPHWMRNVEVRVLDRGEVR